MIHAPTVTDYERMTDKVRRAAWKLIQEEAAAVAEKRARLDQARRRINGQDEHTIAEARRLLPDIHAHYNDTPDITAGRRAALDADTIAYAPTWAARQGR